MACYKTVAAVFGAYSFESLSNTGVLSTKTSNCKQQHSYFCILLSLRFFFLCVCV